MSTQTSVHADIGVLTNTVMAFKMCLFDIFFAGMATGPQFPYGLIDNGVKRQDVDHVFLRFGRRR